MIVRLLPFMALFLSGCCLFTSQDCGCSPSKVLLEEEALVWIMPYDESDYFVFEDSIGNIDSMKILKDSYIEYCGGEECENKCDSERASLYSKPGQDVIFSITATYGYEIWINFDELTQSNNAFIYDAVSEKVYVYDEKVNAILIEDFLWGQDTIEVLQIECDQSSICHDYRAKTLTISKNRGLLQYTTKDDKVWSRIN